MKQRYQLIKDEIMHTIHASPEAMHSIKGLHEGLKDKVIRTEIERAVACLLARQHIKKMGAHVFGLGNLDGIKPYPLNEYRHDALPVIQSPEKSNKQKIAEAEQRRQQQSGSKAFKTWAGGSDDANEAAAPTNVIASAAKQSSPPPEAGRPGNSESDINYAIEQLEHRLVEPPCPQVRDLHIKINVLERLAQIVDPTIGNVLEQIKDDLKGVAA